MAKKLTDEQKAALKAFKERQGGGSEELTAYVRELSQFKKAALKRLKEKPATVPELAEACGQPAGRTLWLIAALRKYGEIQEDGVDGDYVRYSPVKQDSHA